MQNPSHFSEDFFELTFTRRWLCLRLTVDSVVAEIMSSEISIGKLALELAAFIC